MISASARLTPLPWQQQPWQRLVEMHRQQRLHHAMLFTGSAHIGKADFAHLFAQWLLCTHPREDGICGACKSCELNKAATHPDLLIIRPEEKSTLIKVDQIRKLEDFVHQTAQQGGNRVIILHPAEAMNSNAANALLKSLEEPGNDTYLLLVSNFASGLLATIRSRCQRINFAPPTVIESLNWLQQQLPDEDSKLLLNIARGLPLLALQLAQQDGLSQHQLMQQQLEQLLQEQLDPVELAASWQNYELLELFDWLWQQLHLAIKQVSTNAAPTASPLAQKSLLGLYALLDSVQQEILRLRQHSNPNKQLLLEDISIRLLRTV